MKKRINEMNNKNKIKKFKKVYRIVVSTFTILSITTPRVYAAEDPLAVINNLSNFIFDITTAVGSIMVVFGIVQFGLAMKSHDPSQKANSVFTIVGGLIIAFARFILNRIMS